MRPTRTGSPRIIRRACAPLAKRGLRKIPWLPPESWHKRILSEPILLVPRIARTLRPGGLALLHGFSVRQMAHASGGPRIPDQLWTLPMLQAAFPGWQTPVAADHDADLAEGAGHHGPAALLDFVAVKPAA